MKSRLERFSEWLGEPVHPLSRLAVYNIFSWGFFIGMAISALAFQ